MSHHLLVLVFLLSSLSLCFSDSYQLCPSGEYRVLCIQLSDFRRDLIIQINWSPTEYLHLRLYSGNFFPTAYGTGNVEYNGYKAKAIEGRDNQLIRVRFSSQHQFVLVKFAHYSHLPVWNITAPAPPPTDPVVKISW